MCQRIGNLKVVPTKMTLQLADHSIIRSYGVVEDVLVKVCQFTFLVEFVIIDIEEDFDIPLILGRPFMVTEKCVVDIGSENLEMSVEDQKATFNLFEAIKHPSDSKKLTWLAAPEVCVSRRRCQANCEYNKPFHCLPGAKTSQGPNHSRCSTSNDPSYNHLF